MGSAAPMATLGLPLAEEAAIPQRTWEVGAEHRRPGCRQVVVAVEEAAGSPEVQVDDTIGCRDQPTGEAGSARVAERKGSLPVEGAEEGVGMPPRQALVMVAMVAARSPSGSRSYAAAEHRRLDGTRLAATCAGRSRWRRQQQNVHVADASWRRW